MNINEAIKRGKFILEKNLIKKARREVKPVQTHDPALLHPYDIQVVEDEYEDVFGFAFSADETEALTSVN